MTVRKMGKPRNYFIGESTDTKPTKAAYEADTSKFMVGPTDTFYETDTGIMYITADGTTWVVKGTIGRDNKSFFKATSGNSTTDVVLVTPTAGTKIQVLSLNMITASATASNFECYFSVADAMPAAKVIAVRNLDTDAVAEHFVNFGDNGPIGEADEVVSMRTSVDITTNGTYTIIYREI